MLLICIAGLWAAEYFTAGVLAKIYRLGYGLCRGYVRALLPGNKNNYLMAGQPRKTRRITICSKSFVRASRSYVSFPDIRLCGKWLEEAGFRSGHVIDICCERGRLVITLAREQRFSFGSGDVGT